MNNFKLYIARDEGKWDEGVQTTGELNLFYDTPELLFDVGICAIILGKCP